MKHISPPEAKQKALRAAMAQMRQTRAVIDRANPGLLNMLRRQIEKQGMPLSSWGKPTSGKTSADSPTRSASYEFSPDKNRRTVLKFLEIRRTQGQGFSPDLRNFLLQTFID